MWRTNLKCSLLTVLICATTVSGVCSPELKDCGAHMLHFDSDFAGAQVNELYLPQPTIDRGYLTELAGVHAWTVAASSPIKNNNSNREAEGSSNAEKEHEGDEHADGDGGHEHAEGSGDAGNDNIEGDGNGDGEGDGGKIEEIKEEQTVNIQITVITVESEQFVRNDFGIMSIPKSVSHEWMIIREIKNIIGLDRDLSVDYFDDSDQPLDCDQMDWDAFLSLVRRADVNILNQYGLRLEGRVWTEEEQDALHEPDETGVENVYPREQGGSDICHGPEIHVSYTCMDPPTIEDHFNWGALRELPPPTADIWTLRSFWASLGELDGSEEDEGFSDPGPLEFCSSSDSQE